MNISDHLDAQNDEQSNRHEVMDQLEQLICGICKSILLYPVTLPCSHHLCLDCYKKSIEMVNLLCPFCRLRISCWARRAKNNDNNLIDWQKWDLIQTKFPDLVRMRITGDETSDHIESQIFDNYRPVDRVISSEGEIRKEFEEIAKKEKMRIAAEEEATQRLIQQLVNDDKMFEQNKQKLLEDTANDEEIARSLQHLDRSARSLRNREI